MSPRTICPHRANKNIQPRFSVRIGGSCLVIARFARETTASKSRRSSNRGRLGKSGTSRRMMVEMCKQTCIALVWTPNLFHATVEFTPEISTRYARHSFPLVNANAYRPRGTSHLLPSQHRCSFTTVLGGGIPSGTAWRLPIALVLINQRNVGDGK